MNFAEWGQAKKTITRRRDYYSYSPTFTVSSEAKKRIGKRLGSGPIC